MTTRVVVLGAGFGGLELATVVSEKCGADADVTLIDQGEGFVFGFSKLDVMFGRLEPDQAMHRYVDMINPGVRFVRSLITAIDPAGRRVETDAGPFDADTVAGAFALRDVLDRFTGGNVVVGVTSTPFKCPPAPSETALLLDEFLTARGRRDRSEISLVMPLGTPIPPSPQASAAVLAAFAERGIHWHPGTLVRGLDPQGRVALLSDGEHLPYDLFLGVPVHRVPNVVAASGLAVDGWIPVDPLTLETAFPGVYAIGDVTSVGTPKAGVFAEGQAAVAAARIVATVQDHDAAAHYDGRGICYLEFGHDEVAKVDVTFLSGQQPVGGLEGPSTQLAADKKAFGTERIKRWFGKDWAAAS
jgi:sulfide:quinone oxidoreductase